MLGSPSRKLPLTLELSSSTPQRSLRAYPCGPALGLPLRCAGTVALVFCAGTRLVCRRFAKLPYLLAHSCKEGAPSHASSRCSAAGRLLLPSLCHHVPSKLGRSKMCSNPGVLISRREPVNSSRPLVCNCIPTVTPQPRPPPAGGYTTLWLCSAYQLFTTLPCLMPVSPPLLH